MGGLKISSQATEPPKIIKKLGVPDDEFNAKIETKMTSIKEESKSNEDRGTTNSIMNHPR